jgi:hypothetical protein
VGYPVVQQDWDCEEHPGIEEGSCPRCSGRSGHDMEWDDADDHWRCGRCHQGVILAMPLEYEGS